jgi:hypothetical protein
MKLPITQSHSVLSNQRSPTYRYSPQHTVKTAPTEDNTDNVKHRFYEQLEHVFDKFPKHMKSVLGDFGAEVDRQRYE